MKYLLREYIFFMSCKFFYYHNLLLQIFLMKDLLPELLAARAEGFISGI